MPVVRASDGPRFDLQGNTITSFAAPASGAAETIMYRLSVPAGNATPPHRHDHEEVFTLSEGSLAMELGGEKDGATANWAQLAKKACDTIPKCELVILPGLGHVPHFEAPDVFYKALLKFLKQKNP